MKWDIVHNKLFQQSRHSKMGSRTRNLPASSANLIHPAKTSSLLGEMHSMWNGSTSLKLHLNEITPCKQEKCSSKSTSEGSREDFY